MNPRLRSLARRRGRVEMHPELVRLSPEDHRFLTSLYDESVPLPPGAERELRSSNPRLKELRAVYAALDLPVTVASRWNDSAVESFLDLRFFRGDTLITWHYRELPKVTALKYFVLMRYVRERDELGLLDSLEEDGAFGCWTFEYEGHRRVSRDLIESVNEIAFLERELRLSERERFSVLDIGAGYGRLAHRMTTAFEQVDDYCCVDAVPESTFLSEYYLRQRGLEPRARVVSLDRVERELAPGTFDLAVNIHSFPECTYASVEWWSELLRRLRVPQMLVIPNEPDELLTLETDGSRRDFMPLIERAGYRLVRSEPVVDDPAVAELLGLRDRFFLFERVP
ncbi:MAG TPA: putative sugar O-methyltransferase [Thermoleophilaceae bacterium]